MKKWHQQSRELQEEYDAKLSNQAQTVERLKDQLSGQEVASDLRFTGLEKLNALLQQKLDFCQTELSECHTRLQAKEQAVREQVRQLAAAQKTESFLRQEIESLSRNLAQTREEAEKAKVEESSESIESSLKSLLEQVAQ